MKWLKENWFKVGALLGLLIIASSSVYYFVVFLPTAQKETPAKQQTDQTVTSNLDEQQKCADRAAWFFNQQVGDFNSKTTQQDETNSYTDHWNQQMNKCFVLINSGWSANINGVFTLFVDKALSDAFEGTSYGEFTSSGPGFLDGEQKIMSCSMNKNGDGLNMSNTGQQCKSAAEFDAYVASFMGN